MTGLLHKSQQNVYKDANHKLEMALVLIEFEAVCGFIGSEVHTCLRFKFLFIWLFRNAWHSLYMYQKYSVVLYSNALLHMAIWCVRFVTFMGLLQSFSLRFWLLQYLCIAFNILHSHIQNRVPCVEGWVIFSLSFEGRYGFHCNGE